MKLLNPLADIDEVVVGQPARPAHARSISVGILDNSKPNARELMTTLRDLLCEQPGYDVGISAGKDKSNIPAGADTMAAYEDTTHLVLVGSAD